MKEQCWDYETTKSPKKNNCFSEMAAFKLQCWITCCEKNVGKTI